MPATVQDCTTEMAVARRSSAWQSTMRFLFSSFLNASVRRAPAAALWTCNSHGACFLKHALLVPHRLPAVHVASHAAVQIFILYVATTPAQPVRNVMAVHERAIWFPNCIHPCGLDGPH